MSDSIIIEKRCDNGLTINTYYILDGVDYLYIDGKEEEYLHCNIKTNDMRMPKCIHKNLALQDKYRSYTFLAWMVQKSVGIVGWY